MRNFKDELKLQSLFSNNKRKCSCGHSVDTISTHKKDYVICTWCGKKLFKDAKKQEDYEEKLKRENFRMKMWNTMTKPKKKRSSHERKN